MVSVQAPNQRKVIFPEPKNSSKNKRRWEDHELPFDFENKRSKTEAKNYMADIELHLETPLPSEWQRCLDIKSGKIHFYNTKTQTRTCMDPRETRSQSPDPFINASDRGHMISLDLELNLITSESPIRKTDDQYITNPNTTSLDYNNNNNISNSMESSEKKSTTSWPSWLAIETAADPQEMVATVCMRCHMLVMLCRSSPSCPNCKFIYSSEKKNPKHQYSGQAVELSQLFGHNKDRTVQLKEKEAGIAGV
ncbi:protein CURLY FLAG LEAF 1-like [Humulus lupulus]|uniref:protein CURLY FLAG LEAF 1-like n=1 Tax=Humulus lupulus TaxID=3486 RepID=UPI002B407AAA|nr:protein CURLY FLAG LEAF 1-like [Humulus lupulus]